MRRRIQNRREFQSYCLRKLGLGVQNIDITDDQIEDRTDDALDKFTDFHYDGSHTDFLLYTLSADEAKNQEIMLPEFVSSVNQILDSGNFNNWFPSPETNLMSQHNINSLFNNGSLGIGLNGAGFQGYVIVNQYMNMISDLLNWSKNFRYNRFDRKLRLDTVCTEGKQILVDCNRELDINSITEAYNSPWLKKYATELMKKQWGTNLTKFSNAQLSAGVTVDGAKLISDAEAEIEKLEAELLNTYSKQCYVLIG